MNEYYQPLTEDDVKRFSSSLDMSMLSRMIPLKSNIQNQIVNYLSEREKACIINSQINEDVIIKLTSLASIYYNQSPDKTNLFILCMVIGTIIKEYEWGTYYITTEGVLKLSKLILSH